MVVADGVGGWRNKGIDPSLFPYRLLEKVIGASIKSDETKPRNLLDEGYSNLRADPVRTIGSCTVLMGKFDAYKHTVDTAQLGDSVYAILRRRDKEQGQYSVIYQSPEQQHYFNCPHQLGIRDDEETLKKKSRWTAPSDAIEREHSLLPGDIVVLSTDGFSDNVETSELADITNAWAVKSQSVGEKNAGKLAAMLVNGAANFSLDKSKLTPFSRRSTEDGKPRQGGKMDDITVAVVMVNGSSISTSTSNSIGDSESVSPIKSKL
ncbi:hypothetical protein GQ42DRAFT_123526 [Ramicandelaber brevisporus]|nr:hypothetical protein GQ42DRAFT_123526 [Ramicandelaber brevisporus]